MSEKRHILLDQACLEWINTGAPVPLEVSRSRYDDDVISWEVLWYESLWDGQSGCSTPIAEYTTWAEAQARADAMARFHEGVYRVGRDAIVGPLPPTEKERAAFDLPLGVGWGW